MLVWYELHALTIHAISCSHNNAISLPVGSLARMLQAKSIAKGFHLMRLDQYRGMETSTKPVKTDQTERLQIAAVSRSSYSQSNEESNIPSRSYKCD